MSSRYLVTTLEPGARLVLTQDFDSRPLALAFLAKRPAAIITAGLEVFVQLVIAAIKTEPFESSSGEQSASLISLLTTSGI